MRSVHGHSGGQQIDLKLHNQKLTDGPIIFITLDVRLITGLKLQEISPQVGSESEPRKIIKEQGNAEAFELLQLTKQDPVYPLPLIHDTWSRPLPLRTYSCFKPNQIP